MHLSLVPPYISPYLIADLDAQLAALGLSVVHVAPGPVLQGIGWGSPAPVALDHRQIDSYLEAELIAQQLNIKTGTSDSERTSILAEYAQ